MSEIKNLIVEEINQGKLTHSLAEQFKKLSQLEKERIWNLSVFNNENIEQLQNKLIFFKQKKVNTFLNSNFIANQLINKDTHHISTTELKLIKNMLFEVAQDKLWNDDDFKIMMRRVFIDSDFKDQLFLLLMKKRKWNNIIKLSLNDQNKPIIVNFIIDNQDKDEIEDGLIWLDKLDEIEKVKLLNQIVLYGNNEEKLKTFFNILKSKIKDLNRFSLNDLILDTIAKGDIKKIQLLNSAISIKDKLKKLDLSAIRNMNLNNITSIEFYDYLYQNECPNILLNSMIEDLLVRGKKSNHFTIEQVLQYDRINPNTFDKELFAKALYVYINNDKKKELMLVYNYLINEKVELIDWFECKVLHATENIKMNTINKHNEIKVTDLKFHHLLMDWHRKELEKKLSSTLEEKEYKIKSKL